MSHKIDLGCPPHPQRRGVSSRLRRFIERGDSYEIEAQRGTRHETIGGGVITVSMECSILIGEESVGSPGGNWTVRRFISPAPVTFSLPSTVTPACC
jgi:hypothetical protein